MAKSNIENTAVIQNIRENGSSVWFVSNDSENISFVNQQPAV